MAEKETPRRSIQVDETNTQTCYSNFCRVTGSPEELIIDFGMNSQPVGGEEMPVAINQKIVLNFYTAKRLLQALHVSVQRHESVFGNIETDIKKRMKPRPEPAADASAATE